MFVVVAGEPGVEIGLVYDIELRRNGVGTFARGKVVGLATEEEYRESCREHDIEDLSAGLHGLVFYRCLVD